MIHHEQVKVELPTVLAEADMRSAALEEIALANEGRIDAHMVLDAAKDPASVLHSYFDWNDQSAGEKYRLMQAGGMIRRWTGALLRMDAEPKKIKVNVTRRVQSTGEQRKEPGGGYELVEKIMASPDKREDLKRTALRELAAIRKRCAEIEALSEVWQAIDRATQIFT